MAENTKSTTTTGAKRASGTRTSPATPRRSRSAAANAKAAPASSEGAASSAAPAAPASARSSSGARPPGRKAAQVVQQREQVQLALPMLGTVRLPHPKDMAYYTGVAALLGLELLEWPAAVALAAGHALMNQHQNRTLQEFGEALEEV